MEERTSERDFFLSLRKAYRSLSNPIPALLFLGSQVTRAFPGGASCPRVMEVKTMGSRKEDSPLECKEK